MSLDLDARMRVYLASSPPALRSIPTVEISHSAMSQAFYLWREPYGGTIVTEEGARTVQPVNLEIKLAGANGDMDQNFQINLDTTDIQDVFRAQLDRIPLATTEKIRCVYREYMSDDLATILVGPAVLQVESINYNGGAATIVAATRRLNVTRTGELYTPREIPMLRGFL